MTNKEKILEELTRRIDKYGFSSDYAAGKKTALLEFKSFVKCLPEEPVSEGLEETARNYGDDLDNVLVVGIDDDNTIGEYASKAFKDGAKWQKEQMMKQSIDGKVIARFPLASDTFYDDVEIYLNFTKGLSEGDKLKVIVIKDE